MTEVVPPDFSFSGLSMELDILTVENVNKSFYNNKVLHNVSFSAPGGRVLALLGQNGAGKSTLVKILNGTYQKDSGKVLIEGRETTINNPLDAQKQGIAMVYQELSLSSNMSVADNIFVKNLPKNGIGLVDTKTLHEKSQVLLNNFAIDFIKPQDLVEDLSAGNKQIVEILKAVSQNPRILILDEPTSSLEAAEINQLFKLVNTLRDQQYVVIYITHFLKEVFEIADDVLILKDGVIQLHAPIGELDVRSVVNAMVGTEVPDSIFQKKGVKSEKAMLSLRNLSSASYSDINLEVKEGEILGIAGILGSGKQSLCNALFGIEQPISGTINLDGKTLVNLDPPKALKEGIIGLPENRKTQGLFLDMGADNNIIVSILKRVRRGLFVNNRQVRDMVVKYQKLLNIRMHSAKGSVRYLSGGNQQKILVGKCIATNPKLLVAMDPTRGIDVGSKADIHTLLIQLAADGLSVVITSSEVEELFAVCDRIAVMNSGRLTTFFKASEFNENDLLVEMHKGD